MSAVQKHRELIISMRKAGKPISEIMKATGLARSTIKKFLAKEGIRLDPMIAQANAYEARLAKNPDALEQMRKHLTSDVIQKRNKAIKEAYQDETLRKLKAEQSSNWWNSLSSEEREEYLARRQKSMEQSEAVQRYRKKQSLATGDNNNKTRAILQFHNVSSSEELMQKYAAFRGGSYLGDFVHTGAKCRWMCSKGHVFEMRPNNVQQGQWCPRCAGVGPSAAQLEIYEFVKSIVPEHEVVLSDRTAIAPKELDIYVPAKRFGIEFHGLYWHSSAAPGFKRNAHYEKTQLCRERGIRLFAIYEDEWIHKQELVKAMIRWRLEKFEGTKLDARKLAVVRLDKNKDFEEFFERNHLDGHTQASYAYALKHENQIIMVASFRKNFNGELELARLATDYRYSVRGGAGKLLSMINEPLVTFSNNRLSNGEVYRKLGFELIQENKPSYWYTDFQTRIWRFRCKRINDPEVLAKYPSEAAQAEGGVFSQYIFGDNRPLYRIEDHGHRKWLRCKSKQQSRNREIHCL